MEAPLVSREAVLHSMGCRKDDPAYEEYLKAYNEIESEALRRIRPKAAYSFDIIPPEFPRSMELYGKELIYFMITVGSAVTELSDRCIEKGEYMKGLIANAIADSCLFFCENKLLCDIREKCISEGKGIKRMLDAPVSLPAELNSLIASKVDAKVTLGVTLNEAYVFSPIKSYACIFELSHDPEEMNIFHDCERCAKKDDCTYRKGLS